MKRYPLLWPAPARSATWKSSPAPPPATFSTNSTSRTTCCPKGPNDPFFANAESVYDKVNDGEKIFASTKAEVGVRMRIRYLYRPAPASLRDLVSAGGAGARPRHSSPAPADPLLAGTRLDPSRATPTPAATGRVTAPFTARSGSTPATTSTSCSTSPLRKSSSIATGSAFNTRVTTGTSSIWAKGPPMSAPAFWPSSV